MLSEECLNKEGPAGSRATSSHGDHGGAGTRIKFVFNE